MRQLRLTLALVIGVLALGAPSFAAQARPTAAPSLRQLARKLVDVGVPGALVAVHDTNGTRVGTAGYANVRTKERLRATHAFRVGSITKTFVATVVLQLAGEGVLGLDDTLERWLPGLVPNGSSITLRQLLNHTSGIFNYTDDATFLQLANDDRLRTFTPQELVAIAVAHGQVFTPGTQFSYSNTGYILLGLVVEKATGSTVEQQLRTRIIEPLGLTRTSFPIVPTLPAPFAHGYLLPGNPLSPGKRVDVSTWNPSWAWAAGALVSTADDLARFYGALVGGKLLRLELLEQMTRVPLDSRSAYGLGIQRTRTPCGDAWGHGGAVPGYTSYVLSTSDGSRQAVVLINTSVASSRVAVRFETAIGTGFCR